MGEFGKSAGEIASELGVSRQAIYKRLKSDEEVRKALHGCTLTVNGCTYYDKNGEKLIKSLFSKWIEKRGLHSERVTVEKIEENVSTVDGNGLQEGVNGLHVTRLHETVDTPVTRALIEVYRAQVTDLQSEREQLHGQLSEKDKQIEQLQANIKSLTDALNAQATAMETISTLYNEELQRQLQAKQEEQPKPRTFRERFRAWRDRKKGGNGNG